MLFGALKFLDVLLPFFKLFQLYLSIIKVKLRINEIAIKKHF